MSRLTDLRRTPPRLGGINLKPPLRQPSRVSRRLSGHRATYVELSSDDEEVIPARGAGDGNDIIDVQGEEVEVEEEDSLMAYDEDGPSLFAARARDGLFAMVAAEIGDGSSETGAEFTDGDDDSDAEDDGEESDGSEESDMSVEWRDVDAVEADAGKDGNEGEADDNPIAITRPGDPSPLIDPFLHTINDQLQKLRRKSARALHRSRTKAKSRKTRLAVLDDQLDSERYVLELHRKLLRRTQTAYVELSEAKMKVEEELERVKVEKRTTEGARDGEVAARQAAEEGKRAAEEKLGFVREAHDIERKMYVEKIRKLEGRAAASAVGDAAVKVEVA